MPGLFARESFLLGGGDEYDGGPEDLVRNEKNEEARLCEFELAVVGAGPGLAKGEDVATEAGLVCGGGGELVKSRGGDWDCARSSLGGMNPRFLLSQEVIIILCWTV